MTQRFEPHRYASHLKQSKNHAVDAGLLYHWTGTHWSWLSDEEACRSAYAWLAQNDKSHISADYARKAVGAAKYWLPPLETQTNDIVIPCTNGYVHVSEDGLSLKPVNKVLGLKYVLNCSYQPDFGKAELFEALLERVLPEEDVRERVQEYIGYTLMPDARYQKAQLWLGSGANGKGVLANIIQQLHANTAAIRLDAMDGFKLSALVGASLIYVDEIPKSRINEQTLKSLIAGEVVQIDRKYEAPLSLCVKGKWLVLGNHLPAVTDHSIGFWRRWDIVPFSVTIAEKERNPLLADTIIREELPAVLTWALEGLLRLQKRGKFETELPHSMRNILSEAKRETNSVQAWFDDSNVTLSSSHRSAKDDIYQHYREWCTENGMPSMASPRFWKVLQGILSYPESRHRQGAMLIRYCNLVIPNVSSRKAA